MSYQYTDTGGFIQQPMMGQQPLMGQQPYMMGQQPMMAPMDSGVAPAEARGGWRGKLHRAMHSGCMYYNILYNFYSILFIIFF